MHSSTVSLTLNYLHIKTINALKIEPVSKFDVFAKIHAYTMAVYVVLHQGGESYTRLSEDLTKEAIFVFVCVGRLTLL